MSSCTEDRPWWAPRVLGDADVRALLRLEDLVDLQRDAFVHASSTAGRASPRTGVSLDGGALKIASMTAVAPDGCIVTTKVLASAHGNRARGLPRSSSTIVVLDVPTGRQRAVLDSTYLTNARTAAAAVLATETLRLDRDAREQRLGLFGAGPIAELVLAILATRAVQWTVDLYAPTPARRERLAERAQREHGMDVRPVDRPGAASTAPHLIFATDGRRAAVSADMIATQAVIVSVASRRDVAEIPLAATEGAFAVVDERSAATTEAAEFLGVEPAGLAEIGELLAGSVLLPDTTDTRRRVFKSTGLAVQDAVVCSYLLNRIDG